MGGCPPPGGIEVPIIDPVRAGVYAEKPLPPVFDVLALLVQLPVDSRRSNLVRRHTLGPAHAVGRGGCWLRVALKQLPAVSAAALRGGGGGGGGGGGNVRTASHLRDGCHLRPPARHPSWAFLVNVPSKRPPRTSHARCGRSLVRKLFGGSHYENLVLSRLTSSFRAKSAGPDPTMILLFVRTHIVPGGPG
eukprot:COSAG01_NODE_1137_length_11546_cov_14.463091_11_plen_191_part_00